MSGFFLMAAASSPTRSLLGPTCMEFQLKETLVAQLQKPSWCLLVRTMYLREMEKSCIEAVVYIKPRTPRGEVRLKATPNVLLMHQLFITASMFANYFLADLGT